MKRVLALCALFLVSAMPAFATAQMGDKIIIGGKEHFVVTNPLQPYIDEHPDAIPKSSIVSTALWRGYVATWMVKDDKLLLTNVEIERRVKAKPNEGLKTEFVSVMDQVFPGQEEVVATWFTGNLIVPNGKLVQYVHMGYASIYEKYIILRVERGAVTRMQTLDKDRFIKFRDAQFERYKKTDEYQKRRAELIAEEQKDGPVDQKRIEEFGKEFYSERYMSMIFDDVK